MVCLSHAAGNAERWCACPPANRGEAGGGVPAHSSLASGGVRLNFLFLLQLINQLDLLRELRFAQPRQF